MADEAKYSPGDVVQLASGGLPMTVERTVDGRAFCVWFTREGDLRRDSFGEGQLWRSLPLDSIGALSGGRVSTA